MLKKVCKFLLLVSILIFGGCGTTKSFDKFADPYRPFVGYMTVNNWSSKNPSEVMEKLVSKNIQAMPFEFFESPLAYADPNVQARIGKFEKYIKESQKRKILLYVTLLNCNLGNPKTGHPEITAPKCDKQIMAAANAMAAWTKRYPNIYITPCGEGGNQSPAYEKNLQNWCKANIDKKFLVNNWKSRPTNADGMGFYCQHPAGIAAIVPMGAWNMSDHSTTINQLNGGSGMSGTCNYNVAMPYVKKSLKRGPFFYYHYDPNGAIDDTALNALRDAQK